MGPVHALWPAVQPEPDHDELRRQPASAARAGGFGGSGGGPVQAPNLQGASDSMMGGLQGMSDGLMSMLNSAGSVLTSAPSSSGSGGGGGWSGGGGRRWWWRRGGGGRQRGQLGYSGRFSGIPARRG